VGNILLTLSLVIAALVLTTGVGARTPQTSTK